MQSSSMQSRNSPANRSAGEKSKGSKSGKNRHVRAVSVDRARAAARTGRSRTRTRHGPRTAHPQTVMRRLRNPSLSARISRMPRLDRSNGSLTRRISVICPRFCCGRSNFPRWKKPSRARRRSPRPSRPERSRPVRLLAHLHLGDRREPIHQREEHSRGEESKMQNDQPDESALVERHVRLLQAHERP